MITTDMVKACYRVLLNREPENEEIVSEKTRAPNLEALLRDFVGSAEYQAKVGEPWGVIDIMYNDATRHIEYDGSVEQLAACFSHVRREWTLLGEQDPYWSVMTNDPFRLKSLDDKALDAFFASGSVTVSHFKKFLARSGRELPRGHCLEFGCGTGRVTRHLADLFESVTGLDISPGNLELAGENLRRAGISNVALKQIVSPEQLLSIPDYDFLFSTIVLQHNPPPLQNFILDKLLARIRARGGAFVQMTTNAPGYTFKIDDYLKTPSHGLEMHDLPMHVVFEKLDQYNMVPVEVLIDSWTGVAGSHTFFATKRDFPKSEENAEKKLAKAL